MINITKFAAINIAEGDTLITRGAERRYCAGIVGEGAPVMVLRANEVEGTMFVWTSDGALQYFNWTDVVTVVVS